MHNILEFGSPSSRRAWIEISAACSFSVRLMSPSSRRAWIEIAKNPHPLWESGESPSSRRAWIEIYHQGGARLRLFVALLAEGVDRNDFDTLVEELDATVALLAEGVDRNRSLTRLEQRQEASPSSRRAWIEMCPLAV